MIAAHTRSQPGVRIYEERLVGGDVSVVDGLPLTTPERTALEIARRLPYPECIEYLDGLGSAVGVTVERILAVSESYRSAPWTDRARKMLDIMDVGAQSPPETRLRLLLVDNGFPRPRTQIRISDERDVFFLDLGWEQYKVCLEYDGGQHQRDRETYLRDLRKNELCAALGWHFIRVAAEHSPKYTIVRARAALLNRGWQPA